MSNEEIILNFFRGLDYTQKQVFSYLFKAFTDSYKQAEIIDIEAMQKRKHIVRIRWEEVENKQAASKRDNTQIRIKRNIMI